MEINSQPKPDWAKLPRPGCRNVDFRVLLNRDGLVVANLRFGREAEIDEHDAPMDIEVIVIDGAGYVSVEGVSAEVSAGQTILFPKGKLHKLLTTAEVMETVMVERIYQISVPGEGI